MTWYEFQQWHRFDSLHPMPDRLADIHHGILMSALVNITRAEGSAPADAADYFVLRARAGEPETERTDGVSEAERLQAIWRGG